MRGLCWWISKCIKYHCLWYKSPSLICGVLQVRHPFVRLVSAYEDKMLNPHPFPFKWIDWRSCNWALLFIRKVPPLRTTADQEAKARKEGEDPVSEGSLEERQVPEHAPQQGRFKDKVKTGLYQVIFEAGNTAWALVSTVFPWVCGLVDQVCRNIMIIFQSPCLWQRQRGKISNTFILVRRECMASILFRFDFLLFLLIGCCPSFKDSETALK